MNGSISKAIALLGCALFGCSSPTGPGEGFTIEVASIQTRTQILADDTLTVRVGGTIGPNLCYRLDRVESTLRRRSDNQIGRLELRFVGTIAGGPDTGCLAAIAVLDWETKLLPPFGGPVFEIAVLQPSGEALEARVQIAGG